MIDELDAQKRRSEPDKRRRARQTLAIIDGIFPNPNDQRTLTSQVGDERKSSITVELIFDPPNHVRLPRADDEIIDRMVAEQPVAKRSLTLITFDTGMSTRARRAGLNVHKMREPEPPEKRSKDRAVKPG